MSLKKYIPAFFKEKIKSLINWDKNRLTFLGNFEKENELGRLQKDESIFLYGLLKVIRPEVVVEFGFLEGYSASVILSALEKNSFLHSYDNAKYSRDIAISFARKNPNFSFHFKSQDDFEPGDIKGKKIDFVLIDASHNLDINKKTFTKIKTALSDDALIMIHDTGLWQKNFMTGEHFKCLETTENKWLNNETVAHQINERLFVNWIVENHGQWDCINFGSSNILRHGFSLIGSKKALAV